MTKIIFPPLPEPAVETGDSVNGRSVFYSGEQVAQYLQEIERANPMQRPKPTEILPLAGQTCIVRGSGTDKGYVGIVVDWESRFPYEHISVRHPITGVVQNLALHSVELLPPRS